MCDIVKKRHESSRWLLGKTNGMEEWEKKRKVMG
jgi:hypothetical protein